MIVDAPLLLKKAAAAPADYTVENSLKFDGSSSSLLGSSSISTGTTWTVSFWVKRGSLGVAQGLLSNHIKFNADDTLVAPGITSTDAVFRDTSSWYHIFAAPTVGLFINGVQQAGTIDTTTALTWGTSDGVGKHGSAYLDGYLADFHVIDGTAKAVGDFAETDSNGQWVPKEYTGGSYGTNGFHLDFSDSSALGADAAGSNDFDAEYLDSHDQMGDTPSAGKNYATFNPLVTSSTTTPTYSEGNLKIVLPDVNYWNWAGLSTIGFSSGKFFAEARVSQDVSASTNGFWSGLGLTTVAQTSSSTTNILGDADNGIGWWGHGSSGGPLADAGRIRNDSTDTDDADLKFTEGDIIGIGVDLDASTKVVRFFVNGVYKYAFDLPSAMEGKELFFCASRYSYTGSMTVWFNAGQDPTFNGEESPSTVYTDSEGTGEFYTNISSSATYPFKSLCTANLDAPGLNNAVTADKAFEAVAYEGDGEDDTTSGQDIAVSFAPDLVWVKNRDSSKYHALVDTVRGDHNVIYSNDSGSESNPGSDILDITSSGFTVWDNQAASLTSSNQSESLIAWCWKAGSTATNEAFNASAGFSIVKYEGTYDTMGYSGDNPQSVSHSLEVAPELMIIKDRDNSGSWVVYHKDLDTGSGEYLVLDSTDGVATSYSDDPFAMQSPTSSVFKVATNSSGAGMVDINTDATNYIAYLFRSVEGYSKCGIRSGTGSDSFLYLGFKPRFLLYKNISSSGINWHIFDSERPGYNAIKGTSNDGYALYPDAATAESGNHELDFLSNGIMFRSTQDWINNSSDDYIFYAVAENPFKYANAR